MPKPLQFARIRFKVGSVPGGAALEIHPESVVILVGPNNSGKSAALKEIETWCMGHPGNQKIIDDLDIVMPADLVTATTLLKKIETAPDPPEVAHESEMIIRRPPVTRTGPPGGLKMRINFKELQGHLDNAEDVNHKRFFREKVLSNFVLRLDGRTRFSLTEQKPAGNINAAPQNHLWYLFEDDVARKTAREYTSQAFGLHVVVDPTAMQHFSVKMSPRAPVDVAEEKMLDERAKKFYRESTDIQETSDGVQAFTGLVTAMLSLPFKILLVDEPEAFLHPPLSRRLGGNLARLARAQNASLIVSTHSAEFVMGCLEAVPETQIVRLTYENGVATARSLTGAQVQEMIKNPLMRSTGTLRALFHKCAIVTESDTDRSFYDEINTRLQRLGRGIADSLFLNAQNKNTIHRIIGPLRSIGVPAVGVYDLDLIRVGSDFTNMMTGAKIPDAKIAALRTEKDWLVNALAAVAATPGQLLDPLKHGGIEHLAGADLTRAQHFLAELERYGVFLIPIGEVERWLRSMKIAGKGTEWLIDMFAALGDEGAAGYIQPAADDVWAFLDRINGWISNPNRLGIG